MFLFVKNIVEKECRMHFNARMPHCVWNMKAGKYVGQFLITPIYSDGLGFNYLVKVESQNHLVFMILFLKSESTKFKCTHNY